MGGLQMSVHAIPDNAVSKQIIITVSGKAQHGKDSTAEIIKNLLEENGKRVLRINYADFLKYLASQYLGWDGNKDEAGRTTLQQLGNEKVQRYPCFWVATVINIAKFFEHDYNYIIIADCRFPHDINRWREEGYTIIPIHVERLYFDNGLTDEQKSHPTETALNGFNFAVNIKTETLDELEKEIRVNLMGLLLKNK